MLKRLSLVPFQLTQSKNGYLYEGEGDPGTAAPAATPAPATSGAPAAAPAQPTASAQPATSATTPPGATSGESGREGWVPSYRIRESREAAIREAQQQWGQRETALQQELSQMRSQLHALVGVQPPADPQVQNVRNQFGQLYPGLAKLEERAQDLQALIDRAGDLESQTNHYWQTYGRQSMDRLFGLAEKSLGAPLTEEGKRSLHTSFSGWVQSSPELTSRYASDPTIVEDYWNTFTSSFIDPARRAASATVATRAGGTPVPRDVPGGVPPVAGAPKPANLDERASAAWAQYQQTARQ